MELLVVKKDRSLIGNKTCLNENMQILPAFYQTHLKAQLKRSEYLILLLLVALLQSYKWVSIEELANKFPQNI